MVKGQNGSKLKVTGVKVKCYISQIHGSADDIGRWAHINVKLHFFYYSWSSDQLQIIRAIISGIILPMNIGPIKNIKVCQMQPTKVNLSDQEKDELTQLTNGS